ncbi:MAG: hypothetical protein QNL91_12635 [Candidatus Krumholzibacteria bacterium]|nr:hypothetical protein [Candidatus Krumholzibacteria bacterium]
MTFSRVPEEAWQRLRSGVRLAASSLLDLMYPEYCVLCGAEPVEGPWCPAGPLVPGVAWHDGPHLCAECACIVAPEVVQGHLPESGVPVFAGRSTGPELVQMLGQWKYHGVRGLAWPLAPLVRAAVEVAVRQCGGVDQLVPVALHGRRQRQRGFNQALVLARFGVAPSTGRVRSDLLRRTRWTGQQAKLDTAEARQANVAGAFAVRRDPVPGAGRRIGLVDDLVTGGTTCDSAVAALRASGWQVSWVVALGLAGGEAPSNEVSGTDRDRQVDSAPMEF